MKLYIEKGSGSKVSRLFSLFFVFRPEQEAAMQAQTSLRNSSPSIQKFPMSLPGILKLGATVLNTLCLMATLNTLCLMATASLMMLTSTAQAGPITNSRWIKDDEDFGYYKTTVGGIAETMNHNPGAIPSPMARWNITITTLTETNAVPDTVRAEGDFAHTTAVTGHPNEAPLSLVSDFDVSVNGGAMRQATQTFNPVLHRQNHNDAHYVELKATAADNNITGYTLTAVGVHGEDKIRLFDGGQGNIRPSERPNPGPESSLNLSHDSFDTLTFFKNIDLDGVSIPLTLRDFDITVDFTPTNDPVIFDAVVNNYNFEYDPFMLPGTQFTDISRQILDSFPSRAGILDTEADLLVFPVSTRWLTASGGTAATSDEFLIFSFTRDESMLVRDVRLESAGTFVVPEPSALSLVGLGLFGFLGVRKLGFRAILG